MVNYNGVTTRCCGPNLEARRIDRKSAAPIRTNWQLTRPKANGLSGVSRRLSHETFPGQLDVNPAARDIQPVSQRTVGFSACRHRPVRPGPASTG